VGVTILAILAGIAFIINAAITLVFLGALPIALFGRTGFFGEALLGALLWGILALIWAWVALGLWKLERKAWSYIVVVSIINLILAGISVLGSTSWQEVLLSVIANVAILVYSLSPEVKAAFGDAGHPA